MCDNINIDQYIPIECGRRTLAAAGGYYIIGGDRAVINATYYPLISNCAHASWVIQIAAIKIYNRRHREPSANP